MKAAISKKPRYMIVKRVVCLMLLLSALTIFSSAHAATLIGTRTVLAIRLNFPDIASAPSLATVTNRQNGARNNFGDFSYGKLVLDPTVTTEVFTLPNNAAYYDNRPNAMANHAQSLAQGAGYDIGSFDKIGYYYPTGSGLGAQAIVGGQNFWCPGNGGSTVHEMGHTFDWGHARRWAANDQSKPLSANGESVKADYHFMSGGGYDPTPYEKWQRGWITERENITSDGSYTIRLYTFDQRDTDPANALRTVRIVREGFTQTLWLGYRSQLLKNVSKDGNNTTLQQGLVCYWLRSAGSQAVMVDFHAGGGQDNHSIQPGECFSDTAGQIHMTNLGHGGTAPNEYLDIQVNRGNFSSNQPPVPTWNAPSSALPGDPVTITVTGNDPDGDSIACKWNRRFSPPNATASPTKTYTFANPGIYTVTATVTDMKGGTAVLTRDIDVTGDFPFVEGTPLRIWSWLAVALILAAIINKRHKTAKT